jgi:hypothetical protein
MLIVQISLVITLVLTQQVRFKFLGFKLWLWKMLISQISWVKVLVIVQQALVTQISWVKMLVFKRQTSYSTLIGYNVGQVQ